MMSKGGASASPNSPPSPVSPASPRAQPRTRHRARPHPPPAGSHHLSHVQRGGWRARGDGDGYHLRQAHLHHRGGREAWGPHSGWQVRPRPSLGAATRYASAALMGPPVAGRGHASDPLEGVTWPPNPLHRKSSAKCSAGLLTGAVRLSTSNDLPREGYPIRAKEHVPVGSPVPHLTHRSIANYPLSGQPQRSPSATPSGYSLGGARTPCPVRHRTARGAFLRDGAGQKPTSGASAVSAFCSSARHPYASRARDTRPASKTSSQAVLWLSPLLTAHRT